MGRTVPAYGPDLLGCESRVPVALAARVREGKPARGRLHLVGTGVSDSHGGEDQRWATGANNFVSWVFAESPEKLDGVSGPAVHRGGMGQQSEPRSRGQGPRGRAGGQPALEPGYHLGHAALLEALA